MKLPFEDFWEKELGSERILSRNAPNWHTRSPWRDDNHRSFSVNVVNGTFNDFGEHQGGNYLSFIERKHSLNHQEAIEFIKTHYPLIQKYPMNPTPFVLPSKISNGCVGVPSDFRFVEVVNGSTETRSMPAKIVEVKSIFELDCYDLDVQERHVSAFLHCEGLKEYQNKKGKLAGYGGPVKPEFFHFDLDCVEFPEAALSDARKLVEIWKAYKICETEIRPYFSGCKGFHLYLFNEELSAQGGEKSAPDKMERVAKVLFNEIKTLDLGVYGRIGLFRAPNSFNSKGDRYKIPLTMDEFYKMTIAEIKELSKSKRRIEL